MIILPGYHHFGGQQVETAALHNVLAYLGVTDAYTGQPFSETLLFGIGGGIGSGYFVYASGDYTSLFIATRITTKETAQESFLHTICARLGFKVQTQTASSPALAEKKLRQALKEGHPVIAWVDARHLPFPGTPNSYHSLVVYGLDEGQDMVHVADRSQAPLVLPRQVLSTARQGEGNPKFRALVVEAPLRSLDASTIVLEGLRACIDQMREGYGPPNFQSNFGLRALEKWAGLLVDPKDKRGWPKLFPPGPRLYQALVSVYSQIENRGSGGPAFRLFYADFLDEAAERLGKPGLKGAAEAFRHSASLWHELSDACLPSDVSSFSEAKRLFNRRRTLYEEKGMAASDEYSLIDTRLGEISASVSTVFPLDETGVVEVLSGMCRRVQAIRQVEEKAVAEAEQAIL